MWKFLNSLVDRLESRWALYILLSSSGAVGVITAWAAQATSWLNEIGPISWVLAGFVGALTFLLVLGAYAWVSGIMLRNRRAARAQRETNTNPLLSEFECQTIRISDFFRASYSSHKRKSFRSCDVTGPGSVYFKTHVYLQACIFRHCQIVVVDPREEIFGVTVFEECTFQDCELYNVTMYFAPDEYDRLSEDMKRYVPVLNARSDALS